MRGRTQQVAGAVILVAVMGLCLGFLSMSSVAVDERTLDLELSDTDPGAVDVEHTWTVEFETFEGSDDMDRIVIDYSDAGVGIEEDPPDGAFEVLRLNGDSLPLETGAVEVQDNVVTIDIDGEAISDTDTIEITSDPIFTNPEDIGNYDASIQFFGDTGESNVGTTTFSVGSGVVGVVTDENGNPLSDVTVNASDGSGGPEAVTDENGEYTLDLEPGVVYDIEFVRESFQDITTHNVSVEENQIEQRQRELTGSLAIEQITLDDNSVGAENVQYTANTVAEALITDVGFVSVDFSEADDVSIADVTGENVRLFHNGNQVEATLFSTDEGKVVVDAADPLTLETADTLSVEVGGVRNPSEAGTYPLFVGVHEENNADDGPGFMKTGAFGTFDIAEPFFEVSINGEASQLNVVEGDQFDVVVDVENRGGTDEQDIVATVNGEVRDTATVGLDEGDTERATLTFEAQAEDDGKEVVVESEDDSDAALLSVELATIRGTVTDEAGNPINGASVQLYDSVDTVNLIAEMTTGDDGTYLLTDRPADDYTMVVDATGFDESFRDIEPLAAGEDRQEDFTLSLAESVLRNGAIAETDRTIVGDQPLNALNFPGNPENIQFLNEDNEFTATQDLLLDLAVEAGDDNTVTVDISQTLDREFDLVGVEVSTETETLNVTETVEDGTIVVDYVYSGETDLLDETVTVDLILENDDFLDDDFLEHVATGPTGMATELPYVTLPQASTGLSFADAAQPEVTDPDPTIDGSADGTFLLYGTQPVIVESASTGQNVSIQEATQENGVFIPDPAAEREFAKTAPGVAAFTSPPEGDAGEYFIGFEDTDEAIFVELRDLDIVTELSGTSVEQDEELTVGGTMNGEPGDTVIVLFRVETDEDIEVVTQETTELNDDGEFAVTVVPDEDLDGTGEYLTIAIHEPSRVAGEELEFEVIESEEDEEETVDDGTEDEEEIEEDEEEETAPSKTVSPTSVSFGEVDVGNSATETVTISNDGDETLDITGLSTGGDDGFTVSGSLTSLAPGESTTVSVSFTPERDGSYSGSLVVSSNDPDTPTIGVPLSGTGDGTDIEFGVSTDSIDFETVAAGASSSAEVTVSNDGTDEMVVDSISVTGDTDVFAVEPTELQVAGGDGDGVTVTYRPDATGTHEAALEFASDGEQLGSVSLTGEARESVLEASPSLVEFETVPVGESTTAELSVSANIDEPVDIGGVDITGSDAFEAAEFETTVEPDSPVTIPVSFEPEEGGEQRGELQVLGPDGEAEASVSLAGEAPEPSELRVEPETLRLADILVNETAEASVTLENVGDEPLEVTRLAFDDDTAFEVDTEPPFTLDAGERDEVTVTFDPETDGRITTFLTIGSDAAINPTAVVAVTTGDVDVRASVEDNRTRTEATVRNATAGERTTVDVPDAVEDQRYRTNDVSVVPARDGDVQLNVTSSSDSLETTPDTDAGFENNTRQLGNISVDTNLADDEIDEVEFTVSVDPDELGPDTAPEDVELYRFNEDSEEWELRETEVVRQTEDELVLRGTAERFSEWSTAAKQPELDITETEVNVETATVDEEVIIQVFVTNTGGTDGRFEAELLLNREVVDSDDRLVAPEGTALITFERQISEAGEYEIEVNDVFVAEVTILEDEEGVEVDEADDPAAVEPADDDEATVDDESVFGPGFGPAAAVAGLVALLVGRFLVGRRGTESK